MATRYSFIAILCAAALMGSSPAYADASGPFDVRRAGVYDPVLPDRSAADFGDLRTFLWYANFADSNRPRDDADFWAQAEKRQMTVQLGFEPGFHHGGALYSLHLGTLVQALDFPDLEATVRAISAALDKGQDPGAVLAPRKRTIQAQVSYEGDRWVSLSDVDLNEFVVAAVKWARFVKSKNGPVILRPMSEMNEPSSGSWCFSHHAENTPQNYALAWTRLVAIFRAAGASNAVFVFAPLAYNENLAMKAKVAAALSGILEIAPDSIDAVGVNVYPVGDARGNPIPFEKIVRPWLDLFDSFGPLKNKPRLVPEMGIDRATFKQDAVRARWIEEAFRSAGELGFRLVAYFNSTNGAMDFTLVPREGGRAKPGEHDYQSFKSGAAEFQRQ